MGTTTRQGVFDSDANEIARLRAEVERLTARVSEAREILIVLTETIDIEWGSTDEAGQSDQTKSAHEWLKATKRFDTGDKGGEDNQ